jgi:hypothetical protein
MKYAISVPADQTIMYLCDYIIDDNNNIHLFDSFNLSETMDHKEAKLWDNIKDAERYIKVRQLLGNNNYTEWYDIEEVSDEEEFRSREDTW